MSNTCLYFPATKRYQPLASTPFPYQCCIGVGNLLHMNMVYPRMVSINRAQCRITLLLCAASLTLGQTVVVDVVMHDNKDVFRIM